MPNSHIINALTSYKENPDPKYALFLKGQWGCGKSYLVDRWLESQFTNAENKEDAVLEPIKVSLYGMTKTDEITKAIDRQLHPFLYTKFAKISAGILKIAGKIAFRTDLDFNNDGKNDATLTTSLDSLSFLASKDKDIKPDSLKLLVFDDLERSYIPIKQLLGYINYFVEYCDCHVIIVGDDSKLNDAEKADLDEFKEKTVGKEFEVEPDIDAAIKCFIDETPLLSWLDEQRELIKCVFVASKCNNLRILRQCLYDFKLQYNEVDDKLLQNDKKIMRALLASFVAIYCEYKSKNRQLIKNFGELKWGVYVPGDKSQQKDDFSKLIGKYKLEDLGGINVLNEDHMANIVAHIERGVSMKIYIDRLLENDQTVKGVLNRLEDFRNMDNDVFESDCNELSKELLDGKYRQFYPIGKALAFFSLFENERLFQVDNQVIEKAKDTLKDLFAKEVKDAEMLYQCRSAFWQGMNTVENINGSYRIHNEMLVFFNNAFQERDKQLPDKMQTALNNLSNTNVNQLIDIDESSTPDRYSSFSLTPILKNQDAGALFDKIRQMNNNNVRQFGIFLAHHFKLGYNLGGDFTERFKDDEDTLKALRESVGNEILNVTCIRQRAFKYLLGVIEGCINRCMGERMALTKYM